VIDHLPAGGLADAPRHDRQLPTAVEQRAVLTYFEVAPVASPPG
jgi:hypothetical protein